MNEISIECLPDDLPPSIEVDVSGLVETGQTIHVSDLESVEGVEFLTPADYAIVRVVQASKVEEVEEVEEEVVEGEIVTVGEETASEEVEE